MDAKFTRLLHEVHQNRPGDDLEIIRQAWAFCLEQHEGQKRASGCRGCGRARVARSD